MKRNHVINSISLLLVILFIYTATSKLLLFDNFKTVLRQADELRAFAPVLAIFIPTIEIIISVLLLNNKYQKTGLYMSFGLMLIFTIYVTYLAFFAAHRPCACGGAIRTLTWKQHIAFNSSFAILAAIGVWLSNSSGRRADELSKVKFS